jgi:uncharacterized BrkB/YihY/UPF0761 family membrane protein
MIQIIIGLVVFIACGVIGIRAANAAADDAFYKKTTEQNDWTFLLLISIILFFGCMLGLVVAVS